MALTTRPRSDARWIASWISPGSRVLDLGCGDGSLLAWLAAEKGVYGLGVERDSGNILACLEKGVPVVQADLDGGLAGFETGSFDTVILSDTIQQVGNPGGLLTEMLRIGRYGIVSFPNFGRISVRLRLLLAGRMPGSQPWPDSADLHPLCVADFERTCRQRGIEILAQVHRLAGRYRRLPMGANLISGESLAFLRAAGPPGNFPT